jgi:hypothetical protein
MDIRYGMFDVGCSKGNPGHVVLAYDELTGNGMEPGKERAYGNKTMTHLNFPLK